MSNAIDTVTIAVPIHAATATGSFTLTKGGQTATIGYADSTATIQSAMEGLSTIGAGNILVTETLTAGVRTALTFQFRGALANTPIAVMSIANSLLQAANTVNVSETQAGAVETAVTPSITTTRNAVAQANAIDLIDFSSCSPGDTITIGFAVDSLGSTYATYGPMVISGDSATDAAALSSYASNFYGGVVVITDNGDNTFTGTFSGMYYNAAIIQLSGYSGSGSPTVTRTQSPAAGVYQQMGLTFSPSPPTGGTYGLNSNTGQYFNFNDVAATLQTWVQSSNGTGLSAATVTGDTTSGFTITLNDGGTYGTYVITVYDYDSGSGNLRVVGAAQTEVVTTPDSPTQGQLSAIINGNQYTWNWNDDAATVTTAITGSGFTCAAASSGSWTIQASANAADVTFIVSENAPSYPLLKALSATIAQTQAGAALPTITSVSPSTGSTSGGTAVTITGTGFISGATVTIGGNSAASVVVVSSTSITCVTHSHAVGAADVVVTNPNNDAVTASGAFTYESVVSRAKRSHQLLRAG